MTSLARDKHGLYILSSILRTRVGIDSKHRAEITELRCADNRIRNNTEKYPKYIAKIQFSRHVNRLQPHKTTRYTFFPKFLFAGSVRPGSHCTWSLFNLF